MKNTNLDQFIDGETGELFDKNDYYLRSRKQDEAYKFIQYDQQDNRHFSFADIENIREVISNLSTVHCGYLLILQCYMEFGTGKLNLTRKEMPKAVGTSESTFKRFFSKVRSNGIVTVENGEFYINPRFHFRQQANSDRVIKLFTTPLKQLKDELKPSELGFLYKLLLYVHYDTNMICASPLVEPEQIQFLNKSMIAEWVDMEEKKASKMNGIDHGDRE
ncbi:hypothetical protein NDK43_05470 [Neobacillus pocheonensis]|uniref:Replication protein n=1 Tax=Neobacillus pocheonensis TaxID=363869 RepID=A0ABT0W8U6_9BACI|nr:hypothetical protein [Neobacillus pocheonensis]